MPIKSKVRAIMLEVFNLNKTELLQSIDVDNVERWDSLAHLNMIEQLENTFEISIPHEDAINLLSEEAVLEFLNEQNVR